jgi:hypothetical protein
VYESDTAVPLDQYTTNTTLVVKQTPGNTDVRALIDDDYFDYYVNETKMIIQQNPFTRDFFLKNYIIPTRFNESENYFSWLAQDNDYSTTNGDFFYYARQINNTFGGFTYDLEFIYYTPNGALLYYSSIARDSSTGEVLAGGSEHLIYPDFDILSTTSSTTTVVSTRNTSSDQLEVGLSPFIAVPALALIICIRKRNKNE